MNKVGTNNITVSYNGNNYYESSNVSFTVNVTKRQSKVILNDIPSINSGNNVTVAGTVTDDDGTAISAAQVKITINGSSKTLRTDDNGVFTYTYPMNKVGTNNITVIYKGSNTYETAQTSTTVEVIKA